MVALNLEPPSIGNPINSASIIKCNLVGANLITESTMLVGTLY
jgi:hypothetical protein